MIINSLEKMEEIVENNDSLSWDGWTVKQSILSDKGRTSKDGVFLNGKWYMQKRYDATAKGWEIPDKFMR